MSSHVRHPVDTAHLGRAHWPQWPSFDQTAREVPQVLVSLPGFGEPVRRATRLSAPGTGGAAAHTSGAGLAVEGLGHVGELDLTVLLVLGAQRADLAKKEWPGGGDGALALCRRGAHGDELVDREWLPPLRRTAFHLVEVGRQLCLDIDWLKGAATAVEGRDFLEKALVLRGQASTW